MENGKYLFFSIWGKAFILKTDNERKSYKICKRILDKIMEFKNLSYEGCPQEKIDRTVGQIMVESSFVDLEKKNDYISIKSKYFGGAYNFNDFVIC